MYSIVENHIFLRYRHNMPKLSTLESKLNAKQLAVCQLVASGAVPTHAYRTVYQPRTAQSARNGAYTLMQREDVQAVIARLRMGCNASRTLDRIEGEEIVTRVARQTNNDQLALNAVKLAAELGGWLAPTVSVTATVNLDAVLASLPDRPGAEDWADDSVIDV